MFFSCKVFLTVLIVSLIFSPISFGKETQEYKEGLPEVKKILSNPRIEKKEGLLVLYLDFDKGKIWLEVNPAQNEHGILGEFIYMTGLKQGIGSGKIKLDRGRIYDDYGDTRIIVLRRVGGKILIEQKNLKYRSSGSNEAQQRAIKESFPTSTLWMGQIEAIDPKDGRALVDLTPFFIRDDQQVVYQINKKNKGKDGEFELEEKLSYLDLSSIHMFPNNVEVEAQLAFKLKDPSKKIAKYLDNHSPDGINMNLVLHHSFIQLPIKKYEPRRFDPRMGTWDLSFLDFGLPVDKPLRRKYALRYRVEKENPSYVVSKVKNPIVFYVDPAIPEPIRTAVLEGCNWWKQAFEDAGFLYAFEAKIPQNDIDPMDARHNVIQWVHRSTPGKSYSKTIIDPRTGEIIKGHIVLESQRYQRYKRLFEGLVGTELSGKGNLNDPKQLALAWIRIHAAHEVGHALGLRHNFAASTFEGGASVMDYIFPLVRISENNKFDLTHAFQNDIGSWDKIVIKYLYSEFPSREQTEIELENIVNESISRNMFLLSDDDCNWGIHPLANKRDNGTDIVEELKIIMRVRRFALDWFGENNLVKGQPLSFLQETLAPIYFFHRRQIEATVKSVGGINYRQKLSGDEQATALPVDGNLQKTAIQTLLKALSPVELDLSDYLINLLQPSLFGYKDQEGIRFSSRTGKAFDPLGAAGTATNIVLEGLLDKDRAARLVDFHRRNHSLPGLDFLLEQIVSTAFDDSTTYEPERLKEIRRVVQMAVAKALIDLSRESRVSPTVKWRVDTQIQELCLFLSSREIKDQVQQKFEHRLATDLNRYLEKPFDLEIDSKKPFGPLPSSLTDEPSFDVGACSLWE